MLKCLGPACWIDYRVRASSRANVLVSWMDQGAGSDMAIHCGARQDGRDLHGFRQWHPRTERRPERSKRMRVDACFGPSLRIPATLPGPRLFFRVRLREMPHRFQARDEPLGLLACRCKCAGCGGALRLSQERKARAQGMILCTCIFPRTCS